MVRARVAANGNLHSRFSRDDVKKNVVLLVALASFTFLVYAPTLSYEFVYDDEEVVLNNPAVANPSVLLRGRSIFLRSIRTFTFALDHALWRTDPCGYHLTNVLLHVLVVLSLFVLLQRLLKKSFLAFLAALLFAVHPVHVEVVAGIANRKDSLALLFGLWSIFFFMLKERSFLYVIPSFVFLFLAFLSKELVAVSFPLVFLAVDLLTKPRAESWSFWRRHVRYYIPVLLVALLYLAQSGHWELWKYLQRGHLERLFPGEEATYGGIVLRAVCALAYNLKLLYLPWGYAPEHGVTWTYASASASAEHNPLYHTDFYLGLLHLVLLPALLMRARNHPPFAFGVAFFCVTYLPVSNLIPFQERFVAERYLYSPSVGYVVVLALALIWLSRWLSGIARTVLIAGVVLLFSISTILHSAVWSDSLSLWRGLAQSQSAPPGAVVNFTYECIRQGKFGEGADVTRKFLARFHGQVVDSPALYSNYVVCLRGSGRVDQSTLVLLQALNAFPQNRVLKDSLVLNAERYSRAGEYEKSRGILEEFISGRIACHGRFLARVHFLAGRNAGASGNNEEAHSHFTQSVKISPSPEALCALAELEHRRGNQSEAAVHLRSALRLDRSHKVARDLLEKFGMKPQPRD